VNGLIDKLLTSQNSSFIGKIELVSMTKFHAGRHEIAVGSAGRFSLRSEVT